MFTSAQFVEYCKEVYQNKWVYWYGTCGYKCSNSLYTSKKRQYPNHYTSNRTSGYMKDISDGKMCADCVGFIKSFFWKGGKIDGDNHYASNGCPDVSANGMISLCKKTGPIETIPDIPGLVVWKNGHIGVYIGGGYTIELRGFAYDCQKRKVTAGPWTKWGQLPSSMLSYVENGKDVEAPVVIEDNLGDRILKNGCHGNDVALLQEALIKLGYDCGKWGTDGDFGDATEAALKEFQKDHSLDTDGHFGSKSHVALMAALQEAEKPVENAKEVQIQGGNCYVRTEPNVASDNILGVATEGTRLPYMGQTSENGWLLVEYRGGNAWLSGKYGKLVA